MLYYCDQCGKEMKQTAACEFYCANCNNTIFDFSLKKREKREHFPSDFALADFCRGGDLTED